MGMNMSETNANEESEVVNSLGGFVGSLTNTFSLGTQVGQTDTLYCNLRYNLVSNDRSLLSQMYVEHGLVQTMIDQPVDDGFRAGFEIQTGQLDADEIEHLENYIERDGVIKAAMQAIKWARLFGGGGVLIITDQKPDTPLSINEVNDKSQIDYRAIDLWELQSTGVIGSPSYSVKDGAYDDNSEFFMYYGIRIHKSRVLRIKGKEAPAYIKQRLRGWGMSEIERLIRSINQYFKNQNVMFELMDEAKVDVYKIQGFNSALMSAAGTDAVTKRVQSANQVKNFLNAITMDADDDYIQKKMSFSGLAEVMSEIRMQVASDLKMPMSKLFGIPSTGFSSGEDDLENYNAMVEGEVQLKTKYVMLDLISISCQKLFGYVPDDLMIKFNPMRQLSAKEEEEVKNSKFNRTMAAYQSGAIDRETWAMQMNKDNLLPTEVDEGVEALEPLDGQFTVGSQDAVDA